MYEEEDDHKVLSVIGTEGNEGKSTLAKFLVDLAPETSALITTGKTDNIAFILSPKSNVYIVAIDLSRQAIKFLNLDLIEMLKNGYIQSNKCVSVSRDLCHPVQVVLFSNAALDIKKVLSIDRWEIYEVKKLANDFVLSKWNDNKVKELYNSQ